MFLYYLLTGEALKDADNCEQVPIYEDKDGDWMKASGRCPLGVSLSN
jgi:hypothetical protein